MPEPFVFHTSSDLVVLTGQRANTPNELRAFLESCENGCIFHHTFQVLLDYHFITERYANDFAHWLQAAVGEPSLAERIAAVDIRDFVTLGELRTHLLALIDEYLASNPAIGDRRARFPLHLCRSVAVVMPTGRVAHGVEDLAQHVRASTRRTVFYHFVEARLRLGFHSNDFSYWLETQCNRPDLAARLAKLDLYHHTLDDIRSRIADILSPEVKAA
ncbi:MAG: DUF5752 family protein [Candidatus Krumholzibacteriia bacterium]